MNNLNDDLDNITKKVEKISINPNKNDDNKNQNNGDTEIKNIEKNISNGHKKADETKEQKPKAKEIKQSKTNLIINFLPPNLNEGQLAAMFSAYGKMENCKIVVDLNNGRSRGYGFVKYTEEQSAKNAIKALNGYKIQGKTLKVDYARPQCKEIQNANLYISNIPQKYKNNDLRKHFTSFGDIIECRILKDHTGKSRGVGFVRFATHEQAMLAIKKRDGYIVEPGMAPILVKLAQKRAPKRFWNNNNNNNSNNNTGNNSNSSSILQSSLIKSSNQTNNNSSMSSSSYNNNNNNNAQISSPQQTPLNYINNNPYQYHQQQLQQNKYNSNPNNMYGNYSNIYHIVNANQQKKYSSNNNTVYHHNRYPDQPGSSNYSPNY